MYQENIRKSWRKSEKVFILHIIPFYSVTFDLQGRGTGIHRYFRRFGTTPVSAIRGRVKPFQ
jgi:hypothetical protein